MRARSQRQIVRNGKSFFQADGILEQRQPAVCLRTGAPITGAADVLDPGVHRGARTPKPEMGVRRGHVPLSETFVQAIGEGLHASS